ncbi:MAG TPA: hypothetical protein VIN11_07695 [Roseivirga sp.]
MNNENRTVTPPSIDTLKKRSLMGGLIGLMVTVLFIYSANDANPLWPSLWFVKPVILTPLLTTLGGAFFYYIESIFFTNAWNRPLALIIGFIAFIVSLWLGMVLGFNGTYWN